MINGESPTWLVQILLERPPRPGEPKVWVPYGAGFLVTPDRVVTCAHVIDESLSEDAPVGAVKVRFEFVPGSEPVAAEIEVWLPADDKDIAVLRLTGETPTGAQPAPLCSDEGGVAGHAFLTYGYPKGFETHAIPAAGSIVAGGHKLTLNVRVQEGFALERGFSGAPVWDRDLQAVVGLVVLRVSPRTEYREIGPRDIGVGFAIPLRQIAEWWPDLSTHVRRPSNQQLRDQLAEWTVLPLKEDGTLPLVREVDPYDIGVARSTQASTDSSPSTYVSQPSIDAQLDDALRDARFVLAIGPSAVGKSRAMIEAVRRTALGAQLAVPTSEAGAVRQLASLARSTNRLETILWLDDLNQYLGAKGLDLKVLEDLQRMDPPVRIAATMTSQRFADHQKVEGTVGMTMRNVLARATVVRLERGISDETEIVAAQQAYPQFSDDDLRKRGIGALLVAAHELDALYRDAKDLDPAGWAVLQATIDWRRIGLESPLSEQTLRVLFTDYLESTVDPLADPDAAFGPALARVLEPVSGTVSAVTRIEQDGHWGYRAYDYLKELADSQRDGIPARPVPTVVRQRAMEHGTPRQLLDISFAALSSGRVDAEALERARAQDSDAYVHAWATVLLGEYQINAPDGDRDHGLQLLREAVGSEYSDVVSISQVDLGAALLNERDIDGAAALLEAALTADDPGVRLLAKANLGVVYQQRGDLESAEQLYSEVMTAGDGEVAELATAQLGQMLIGPAGQQTSPAQERARLGQLGLAGAPAVLAVQLARTNMANILLLGGEPVRARSLLVSVVTSDDVRVRPFAQAALAWLELAEGNRERGVELLRQAIESNHPQARNYATLRRGLLAQEYGDIGAAAADLRTVAESEDAEYSPWAVLLLGDLLAERDDAVGAEQAFRTAVAYQHAEWSPMAKISLARLLGNLDDDDADIEALALLRTVVQGEHAVHRLDASIAQGELLGRRGDIDGAEGAYRLVIDSDDEQRSNLAKAQLAELFRESGDKGRLARAETLLRDMTGSGDSDWSVWAYDSLGDLLLADNDVDGAKSAYEKAIESGHPRWSLIARIDLAVLQAGELEDYEAAADQLKVAAATEFADIAASAHLTLGFVRLAQERRDDARTAFLAATGPASAQVDLRARFALTKLAAGDGDLMEADAQLDALISAAGASGLTSEVVDHGPAFIGKCDYLLDVGETDAAEEILVEALAGIDGPDRSADPEVVTALKAVLGRAAFLQNDYQRARELLESALAEIGAGRKGNPPVEALTRRFLASTLVHLDEPGRSRELLGPVVESGDLEHRAAALDLLGMLDSLEGRNETAAGLFRAARDAALAAGDEDTADAAAAHLQHLETSPSPAPTTRPALPRAPRGLSPLVRVLLGELASAHGDRSEADYWITSVLAGDVEPELSSRARLVAAVTAFEARDLPAARQHAAAVAATQGPWSGRARTLMEDVHAEMLLVNDGLEHRSRS